MLTVTAASGSAVDRAQLVARIAAARKIDAYQVEAAISELAAAGLVLPGDESRVGLSEAGQGRYREIRAVLEDVTARLFAGFPPEDLATAGRVLSIVTTRANAELADRELSWAARAYPHDRTQAAGDQLRLLDRPAD